MKLTIEDLREYAKMDVITRHTDRGKEIRQELNERMRWMPMRWRRIVRCRYIMGMSILRTSMELNISKASVTRGTREIARWLVDTDKYLEEQV